VIHDYAALLVDVLFLDRAVFGFRGRWAIKEEVTMFVPMWIIFLIGFAALVIALDD
jgi:hypothetical protein